MNLHAQNVVESFVTGSRVARMQLLGNMANFVIMITLPYRHV